jgi:hypothetical protein
MMVSEIIFGKGSKCLIFIELWIFGKRFRFAAPKHFRFHHLHPIDAESAGGDREILDFE